MKIILCLLLAGCVAQIYGNDCVPPQSKFYWESPCEGQTFSNRITINDVKITQDGKDLDTLGGFNLTKDLDIAMTTNNQYGQVNTPLLDLGVKQYLKVLGKCQWVTVPGSGILININSCDFLDDCHLTGHPNQITGSMNVRKLLGPLVIAITVGDYYGVSFTFKDSSAQLACVYIQDIIISQ